MSPPQIIVKSAKRKAQSRALLPAVRVVVWPEPPSLTALGKIECSSVSIEGNVPVIELSAKKLRFCFPDSHVFWTRPRHRLAFGSLSVCESRHCRIHRSDRRQLLHVGYLRVELFQFSSQTAAHHQTRVTGSATMEDARAAGKCVNADDTWDDFSFDSGPRRLVRCDHPCVKSRVSHGCTGAEKCMQCSVRNSSINLNAARNGRFTFGYCGVSSWRPRAGTLVMSFAVKKKDFASTFCGVLLRCCLKRRQTRAVDNVQSFCGSHRRLAHGRSRLWRGRCGEMR